MESLRLIFLNRHSEIRSGWKVLLSLFLIYILIFLFTAPLRFFEIPGGFAGLPLALLAVIAGSFIMTRFVNHKPLSAIGLWFHRRTLKEFLWGTFLGFLMIFGIFLLLLGLGSIELQIRQLTLWEMVMIVVSSALFFALGAMIEEVIFRGYPFQTLVQGITLLPAVILMALLFGGAHMRNPNVSVLGIVNVVLAAIWLSFAYLKTRGLWLPFGLHFGWNFSQTTVFSFPTSGIEFADRKLFSMEVTGPDWLTGGAFGPEGSVLATLALATCTWYVLKAPAFSAIEGIITLDSIEDLVPGRQEDGTPT